MHFSNYAENAILDHILGTTALTQPTMWGALHSDAPGETGANELTGGSYARQTIAFDAAVSGTADNTAAESWDLTGVTSGNIMFVGLWDASTVGNFYWTIPLGGTPNTFTLETTGEVATSYGHGWVDDVRIVLEPEPGSALPTGLSADVVYFVDTATTDTFQIAATSQGGPVATTTDGEGIAFEVDIKSFNSGDTFQIAAGDLDVFLN